jgi:hypothetical protein
VISRKTSLISLGFLLLKNSSNQYQPRQMGLLTTFAQGSPQSYPQKMWTPVDKPRISTDARSRPMLRHNHAAFFFFSGVPICFPSYKPQAGRSGP